MKLKYVSVLRRLGIHAREGGYIVRGELECQPTSLWFKHFQLFWVSTPAYRKLCTEPRLNRNEILIPISEWESISAAIEALKDIMTIPLTQHK